MQCRMCAAADSVVKVRIGSGELGRRGCVVGAYRSRSSGLFLHDSDAGRGRTWRSGGAH
jgi:hypothetical protein